MKIQTQPKTIDESNQKKCLKLTFHDDQPVKEREVSVFSLLESKNMQRTGKAQLLFQFSYFFSLEDLLLRIPFRR